MESHCPISSRYRHRIILSTRKQYCSSVLSLISLLLLPNPHRRDIKTTNILVDKDWRAKICDFSFSCHVDSLLKQEFVYGTDEFMSPEIAMGEDFGLPAGVCVEEFFRELSLI
jgi:serine/threonine protein kinase